MPRQKDPHYGYQPPITDDEPVETVVVDDPANPSTIQPDTPAMAPVANTSAAEPPPAVVTIIPSPSVVTTPPITAAAQTATNAAPKPCPPAQHANTIKTIPIVNTTPVAQTIPVVKAASNVVSIANTANTEPPKKWFFGWF